MPTYTPPAELAKLLKEFDEALRVRWSDGQQRWRLERRVSRGQVWPPSEVESPEAYEDRQAARDGYILVDYVDRALLNGKLLDVLRAGDIWARGGADAVADQLDRYDAEHLLLMRRMVGNYVEEKARERWRYMNRVRTVSEAQAHTAPVGGMSINGGV